MIKFIAFLAITGVPLSLLAQEAVPVLPPWASWGVLGLVVAGFVTKQLVPGWLYADLRAENKEQKAEITRLVNLALDTQKATLPAIEASTTAVTEALNEIRASRRAQ